MTGHRTEKEAMVRLLEMYGSKICACVMDSYDYMNALEKVLPSVAQLKTEKGGFLVLRPDSGDPIDVVMKALQYFIKFNAILVPQTKYSVVKLIQKASKYFCHYVNVRF
jgi:nicotinic acid phosphoribosyltransferase